MSITEQEREDRRAMDALREVAEGVASDIHGDFPQLDTSYDLWADRLSLHGIDGLFGVVDMGDVYQGVYVWLEGAWAIHTFEAQPVIEKMIEVRRQR